MNQIYQEDKLQSHYCFVALQEALSKLNKNNIEITCQNILQSPLVVYPHLVRRVAFDIFYTASIRPGLIPYLVDVCKCLIDNQSFQNSLSTFKDLIAPKSIPKQRWYRSFLINCINKQVLTIEEFMNLLTSYPPGESIYLLFCWFAPVIQSRNKTIYENILYYFMKEENLTEELQFFKKNFTEMQKNDWELQRKYFQNGYYNVSFAYYIKNDKCRKLLQIASLGEFVDNKKENDESINEKFDFNQRIENSLFERCEIVRHHPTLLQFAAFFGAKKCFSLILNKGADPNIKDDEGRSLIQFVIAGGNSKIFTLCLESKKIFFKDTETIYQALETAVEYNRFDMMEKIIEEFKIDIQKTNEFLPVLHCAAKYNNVRVILYCLEKECPINMTDINGRTPLHYAVEYCQYDSLFALIDAYDIDVNVQDENGKTPLHLAAKNNQNDCILILATNPDLDLNSTDASGNNPVIIATKKGYYDIVYYLCCQNIDVNHKNSIGMSPLHFAAKKGQVNIVSLLLTHCQIDVNIQDEKGIL